MRNLKKILCLALVLSMVLAVVSGAAYTNYKDDADLTMVNEEYLLAAQLLQDIGVVVGVNNPEDGKTYYYPDNLLTRAELARVLYVLYSGTTDSAVYDPDLFRDELPTTFTDISGHWAEGYIKYGQAMGYLNGKSASIFDPDANVKAQEMATALLIVLGYKAADIAPNYPINVVKYAYTNNEGNLFTTGLSTAAASGGDHGIHVVGLGAALGFDERDNEGEFQLVRELTREEAFYMLYKAITKRSMVSKNLNIAGSVANVDGTYYYNTGDLYVNYKFNAGYAQTENLTAVVAGSKDYAFTGKYAKDGTVVLETADGTSVEVKDFGYTAAVGAAGGSAQGYGFILSATDWTKQLGRKITYTATTFKGKTYITEYAFGVAVGKATAMRSFVGSDVKVVKAKKVEVADGKIKINGTAYAPYFAKYRYIFNNATGVEMTAAELAAVLESEVASNDEIALKVIDGKLYGVLEEENFYATVTDVDKDGIATLKLLDGSTIKLTNKYELAKGERIFGLFNMKNYEAALKDFQAGTIKYIADGLTLEFVKATATELVNVAVATVDGVVKYYYEDVKGTEFKLGAASDLDTDFDGNYIVGVDGAELVKNETAYWTLVEADGYCFEAIKTEKEKKIDLYVTSKSVVYNTTDNKVTYTFALNTKADGKGDSYTFTKTTTDYNAAFDAIVKGDVVVYTCDAKTGAVLADIVAK